jgi:hypothetical protein
METQKNQVDIYPNEFPLQTVNALLGFRVSKLVIRYYIKKVSVSCRYQGNTFGSSGKNLYQALYFIKERIGLNQALQN